MYTDRTANPSASPQQRLTQSLAVIGLAVLTGLLTCAPAAAQGARDATGETAGQPPDTTALSLEQLLEVEVESVFGASKSLQKITEAPAAVTVVTADEIERFGWRTLADVMRSVRGFYVTNDRAYSYVGARGFLRPGDYNARVLVTLDGRRLNDNVFDQAPFEDEFQVDMSTVERVEIIRGPSSSLYGSSAFFGVINVITKPATQGRAREVTLGAGTLGHGEATFRTRHDFASGVSLSLSATGLNEHGNRRLYYPEYDSPGSSDGVAHDLDYLRHQSVFVRADYGTLVVSGGYNSRTRGLPTGAYQTLFNLDSSLRDEHTTFNVTWSHALGSWAGLVRGSFDDYDYTGSYPYDWETPSGTQTVRYMDLAAGHWWGAEAQLSRNLFRRHHVTTGIEYRLNSKQDQFSYLREPYELLWTDSRRSNTAGFFAQDQMRVTDRLLLNVGVRQDHYAAFSDPLKPRVAAIYNPRLDTTLKIVYGSAFRAPNVFESYYEIPGLWRARPELAPEQIRTVEGIIEHYAGRRLRLAASAYQYHVDGLIDFATDADTDLLYFGNLGSARARGIEAEAEAKWPGGLQARLSYTFADARNTDTGETLSNSPRHLTQALLSAPLPGTLTASLDMQILSSRLTRTGALAPAYARPTLTVTAPFSGRRGRLTLQVGDLTNERHGDPVGDDFAQDTVQQNGRTTRVFLTFAF